VERLLLVRHAHSASNRDGVVSGAPPGEGLSALGVAEAQALRAELRTERVDVGLATELLRTRETLRLALADRPVPTGVCAGLNEIGFGAFESGSLERYRAWAWRSAPDAPCPGGGESRAAVALRLASSLERLLERPETAVLAVSHALPVRYVLDAAAGRVPRRRVEPVPHAVPLVLSSDEVARAAATLATWSRAPRFRDGDDL
jgi:broad specificity phosphatase PhoE